ISQSPTEVQPVFDAIVLSGAALCHAPDVIICIGEGDALRVVASVGPLAATVQRSRLFQEGRLPLNRGSVAGRAFLDRCTVHVHDVSAMADEFPEGRQLQQEYGGHGTTLAVPLLREGVSLGVITLVRSEISPLTEQQITLLETFASQAVIAIENVRLFTEVQASNRELRTALDTQTATSDILGVISRSQTDVHPVFDAIVTSAVRLLGAYSGLLTRVEGDQIVLAALTSTDHAGDAALRAIYPMSVQSGGVGHAQVIRDRQPFNLADAHSDARLSETGRAAYRSRGSRSQAT